MYDYENTPPGNNVPAEGDTYEYPMYDVALAFGDSITQHGYEYENSGWLTHFSARYARRMDILNRGFSGYNTTRAKQVAPLVFPIRKDALKKSTFAKRIESIKAMALGRRVLKKSKWPSRDGTFPTFNPKVQLCILFFGANDSANSRDGRHTPLNEYSENLRYLVNMLHDPESQHYSPDTRILIITPPAVGDKMTEEYFKDRGWKYNPHKNTVTKKYAEAAVAVARDLKLPFVDTWTAVERRVQGSRKRKLMLSSTEVATETTTTESNAEQSVKRAGLTNTDEYDGYDEYLVDGLHLNSKGNELLFKLVSEAINRNWPELRP
ncbi:isoamyl acetate-hydrolyzing esterase [Coemansia sp. RSA 487]|nr:isoamyl acetate-hydrolyzing esterase [Coemansia sp. RSA 487]